MKNVFGCLVVTAAIATAQVTRNDDGTYTCATPSGAYCAGDSLKTDIIIRCNGGVGQPGRCSNNLVGQPPVGNTPALCWQSSETSGDAACEKNCVIYGSSGNFDGTSTLPADVCTPTFTASTSAIAAPTATSEATDVTIQTSTNVAATSEATDVTIQTSTNVIPAPTVPAGGNGTITLSPTSAGSQVPVGPTATTSTVSTAGASSNKVYGVMAAAGAIAACLV